MSAPAAHRLAPAGLKDLNEKPRLNLQPLTAARLCGLLDEYTRTREAALRLPRSAS